MKDKIIEFLKLPPVIVVIGLVLYALIGPHLKHPAEKMSVETFLYYHTAEEIAEFLSERGELDYLADALADASGGELYSLCRDEADDLVNQAYAYGYYHGAIHEAEYREEWGYEGYYQELTDAIHNGDLALVYDYTKGSYCAKDFME